MEEMLHLRRARLEPLLMSRACERRCGGLRWRMTMPHESLGGHVAALGYLILRYLREVEIDEVRLFKSTFGEELGGF